MGECREEIQIIKSIFWSRWVQFVFPMCLKFLFDSHKPWLNLAICTPVSYLEGWRWGRGGLLWNFDSNDLNKEPKKYLWKKDHRQTNKQTNRNENKTKTLASPTHKIPKIHQKIKRSIFNISFFLMILFQTTILSSLSIIYTLNRLVVIVTKIRNF